MKKIPIKDTDKKTNDEINQERAILEENIKLWKYKKKLKNVSFD